MRRPRHREKSNLLWKMLGIAGVINLILWPILIHEGVFTGIRQEVLIPVRLVSTPPSHKLPDALQKVARASAQAPPAPPPVAATPHRRPSAPKPPASPVTTDPKAAAASHRPIIVPPAVPKKPAKAAVPVHSPVAAQKPVDKSPPRVAKQMPPPRHVTAHSIHTAQAKPVTPISSHPAFKAHPEPPAHMAHVVRPALQARIDRAQHLEAQGHKVAEWLAKQRTARVATLPPPTKPTPPVVSETPSVPSSTGEVTDTDKINVITPTEEAPPEASKPTRPATAAFVPAVAICKSHPAVPDSMMRSAWHATFHGRFTVHPDGTATVQMISSTGFPVLDRRAIEAARQWKFRPARLNGEAVTSTQTFAFEFDVHPIRL